MKEKNKLIDKIIKLLKHLKKELTILMYLKVIKIQIKVPQKSNQKFKSSQEWQIKFKILN